MTSSQKARPRSRTEARDSRAQARKQGLLDDLGALALFAEVVERRSFTGAARRTGTTTSAASKRIAALESRLGVRLLERSTRQAAPTEAGRVLYERCQRLLHDASEAQEAVLAFRGQLAGTLRVSAAATFGRMHILPLVSAFMERHPDLRVSLSLNDRSVDLIESGTDVAIRSGRVLDSGLMSRKIGDDRRVICATPAYLAKHGTPRTPADLRQHRCLRHPLMAPSGGWAFITPEGSLTVPVSGPLEIDNVAALRDVALESMGITLLPAYAIAADLRAGQLVSLLAEYIPPSAPFRALWVSGRPRRVTSFVDFLAVELPKRL
ncbi:MAG: LysR family transcriptional regulator [Myxococcota bacterium]